MQRGSPASRRSASHGPSGTWSTIVHGNPRMVSTQSTRDDATLPNLPACHLFGRAPPGCRTHLDLDETAAGVGFGLSLGRFVLQHLSRMCLRCDQRDDCTQVEQTGLIISLVRPAKVAVTDVAVSELRLGCLQRGVQPPPPPPPPPLPPPPPPAGPFEEDGYEEGYREERDGEVSGEGDGEGENTPRRGPPSGPPAAR